jgi:hypothetical protein
MSLINIGAGLSQAGNAVSEFAGNAGLAAQKSALEQQRDILADQLQGKREQANIAATGANEIANTTLVGKNQLATTAAQGDIDQANISATGGQQRQTQEAANKLPPTQFERGQLANQHMSASASLMEATKPISGGYTGSFLVRNPQSGKWEVQTAGSSAAPVTIDKSSNNLTAQTGLSEQAIRAATGQLNGRFASPFLSELQQWGQKTGTNVDTLVPQAKAAFNILQNNIQRNNQGTILEHELQGSVENAGQIADALHQGKVSMANVANVWAGKQVNDPDAIKAADQLSRLREELAGYNAVAGGHLMENGTPHPTPENFRAAEATITNGINSGGLKALSQSIAMSQAKNRNVLEKSIDNANKDFYALFNAEYHAPNRANEASAGGGGPASGGGANIAPAGTKAVGPDGDILSSDGKGGWN